MSGHEDNGGAMAIRDQALLQLDSAHTWHHHVGNQARRIVLAIGAQIFISGGERLTMYPNDRMRLRVASRTDSSSSTMEITGVLANAWVLS